MADEHGKTKVGFWLRAQDAKEEWMIDHKRDWGWRRWADNGAFHTELGDGSCSCLCSLFVNLEEENGFRLSGKLIQVYALHTVIEF